MNIKKRYVIVGIIGFLLLGIFEIFLFTRDNTVVLSREVNQYTILPGVKEEEGIEVYTNDFLSSQHCMNSICIEGATFHYKDQGGRVDYTIMNQSSEVASGFLKMVFGGQSLVIAYQNIEPGQRIETSSYYGGGDVSFKEDYSLNVLSDEEIRKIHVSK